APPTSLPVHPAPPTPIVILDLQLLFSIKSKIISLVWPDLAPATPAPSLRRLPASNILTLPASNFVPTRSGDGALQEQRARHRVQLVRGARLRRAPRHPSVHRSRRGDRTRHHRRGCPIG